MNVIQKIINKKKPEPPMTPTEVAEVEKEINAEIEKPKVRRKREEESSG